jgi:uncharacterized protein
MTTAARRPLQTEAPASRLERLAWNGIEAQLEGLGYATTGPLLTPTECLRITGLYDDPARFRRRIVMQRHAYGEGEYQYFAYPLPEVVAGLRHAAYPKLAPIANRWQAQLGLAGAYPDHLEDFLARCHDAGQTRPTPLLLKYGRGDYNRLHQDLYGALHFPLQMAILLSAPGTDFEGGEVRADRAAPTHPVTGRGRALAAGRSGDLRGQLPSGAQRPRPLPPGHAPRRQPAARRLAVHARHHFSRCRLTPRRLVREPNQRLYWRP